MRCRAERPRPLTPITGSACRPVACASFHRLACGSMLSRRVCRMSCVHRGMSRPRKCADRDARRSGYRMRRRQGIRTGQGKRSEGRGPGNPEPQSHVRLAPYSLGQRVQTERSVRLLGRLSRTAHPARPNASHEPQRAQSDSLSCNCFHASRPTCCGLSAGPRCVRRIGCPDSVK